MHEIDSLVRNTPWLQAASLEDPMVRQMIRVAEHRELTPAELLGMIAQRALAERDEIRQQLLMIHRNMPAPFMFKGRPDHVA